MTRKVTSHIEYACPHIDEVLDAVNKVSESVGSSFSRMEVDDLEKLYDAADELSAVKKRLEEVRTIAEELRQYAESLGTELAAEEDARERLQAELYEVSAELDEKDEELEDRDREVADLERQVTEMKRIMEDMGYDY